MGGLEHVLPAQDHGYRALMGGLMGHVQKTYSADSGVSACLLWPLWKGQKVHEESGQRMLGRHYQEARTFTICEYSPSSLCIFSLPS